MVIRFPLAYSLSAYMYVKSFTISYYCDGETVSVAKNFSMHQRAM